MMCLILAQLRLFGQEYVDYYKGDTLVKADKNTYAIRYSKLDLGEKSVAYIYVNNINNKKLDLTRGLMDVFYVRDKKVFDDVVKNSFTQGDLKAMYKELKNLCIYKEDKPWRKVVAFEFRVSANKHTDSIELFEVSFNDTPAMRNISLKKIEQMENQVRERVRFKLFEGRRQFLDGNYVYLHDYIRVYFKDIIDDFESL